MTTRTVLVNHVLSTRLLPSTIFDDLIRRFTLGADADIRIHTTIRPDKSARIWHYHRPHREGRLRCPSVVTIHHDPEDRHWWLRPAATARCWKQASRIICLNSRQQEILRAWGIGDSVVIPHGIDRDYLPLPTEPRRVGGGKIGLGMVSKRYDRGVKGETRLHELFARLDPHRFRFVLVGRGRWRDAAAARRHGFEAECYEALPYPLMGNIYRRIDLLLILSDSEGGPACLPEALGSGVPVASTPVGMTVDWLKPEVNGVLLTGNASKDAAVIADLAEAGAARLNHLALGAFAGAADIPEWREIVARHMHLYRELA